tara:strand:- start:622 stop:2259 length:1638 start_codon:yes stop_codon:yes gene_type:complete
MKKKVRLISLNLNERDLSIALVGLKQYAELNKKVKSNFDIHIHQWNKNYANMGNPNTIEGLGLDEIIESLDPLNTDIFGFSTYIWNFDFMMKISKKMKNINPSTVNIFGGSQAGGMGGKLFSLGEHIDYLISGEAELSFRKFLLGYLDNDYSDVENLTFRSKGELIQNIPDDKRLAKKQSYLESIEELPYPFRDPDYRSFLDNLDYKVTAQFETERGCPLACTFCSWGTRLPIRRREQGDVEEGLTYLLNHPNVRAVYIVDANPFIKDEKGLWLTDFLLNKNKTGKPVFFELNPEYVRDPQVIKNLGKLSGDELAFGLQSTSDQTLKIIKRKFNRELYEKNVKALKSMNPDANIKFSLIVGLPGDNFNSFSKSLEFVISLNPTDIYVHDLLVLPGSEMYENPEKFNISIDYMPPHRLIENKTFPVNEYNRAKKLGYYAKLIHKYKWLSVDLLKLKNQLGVTSISLYQEFIVLLELNGLDGLFGTSIGDVSSEKFDYLTDKFKTNKDNEIVIKDLYQLFKTKKIKTHYQNNNPNNGDNYLQKQMSF